jgi:hypothetical protein
MSSPVLSSGIGPGLGGLEDELDSSRNLGQCFIKPKYIVFCLKFAFSDPNST